MSLLITKQTDLRDRATCLHLYFTAFLTFCILFSAIDPRGLCLTFVGEELWMESFVLDYFVLLNKLTHFPSSSPLYKCVCDKIFPKLEYVCLS